jgi:TctA family transporter
VTALFLFTLTLKLFLALVFALFFQSENQNESEEEREAVWLFLVKPPLGSFRMRTCLDIPVPATRKSQSILTGFLSLIIELKRFYTHYE